MRALRRIVRIRWIALLGSLMACGDHDQFRADVFLCEEAARHVGDCCGGNVPTLHCDYAYDPAPIELWCDPECKQSTETFPDLSIAASRCVMHLACDEIAQNGICQGDADGLLTSLRDEGCE
jgi:hypothetical protein